MAALVVESYRFQDRLETYERFKIQFCDAPELIAATLPENLPESFVVTVRRPADIVALRDALGSLAAVDEVVPVQ